MSSNFNDESRGPTTSESLHRRIELAWGMSRPIQNGDIIEPGTLPIERRVTEGYFFDRPLSEVDPGDPAISNEAPYNESFSIVAMQYYAGRFLAHLLWAYHGSEGMVHPYHEKMSAMHFLFFLASERAKKVAFTKEQAAVIASVLEYVVNSLDVTYLSEEQLDQLLKAVEYWSGRSIV